MAPTAWPIYYTEKRDIQHIKYTYRNTNICGKENELKNKCWKQKAKSVSFKEQLRSTRPLKQAKQTKDPKNKMVNVEKHSKVVATEIRGEMGGYRP